MSKQGLFGFSPEIVDAMRALDAVENPRFRPASGGKPRPEPKKKTRQVVGGPTLRGIVGTGAGDEPTPGMRDAMAAIDAALAANPPTKTQREQIAYRIQGMKDRGVQMGRNDLMDVAEAVTGRDPRKKKSDLQLRREQSQRETNATGDRLAELPGRMQDERMRDLTPLSLDTEDPLAPTLQKGSNAGRVLIDAAGKALRMVGEIPGAAARATAAQVASVSPEAGAAIEAGVNTAAGLIPAVGGAQMGAWLGGMGLEALASDDPGAKLRQDAGQFFVNPLAEGMKPEERIAAVGQDLMTSLMLAHGGKAVLKAGRTASEAGKIVRAMGSGDKGALGKAVDYARAYGAAGAGEGFAARNELGPQSRTTYTDNYESLKADLPTKPTGPALGQKTPKKKAAIPAPYGPTPTILPTAKAEPAAKTEQKAAAGGDVAAERTAAAADKVQSLLARGKVEEAAAQAAASAKIHGDAGLQQLADQIAADNGLEFYWNEEGSPYDTNFRMNVVDHLGSKDGDIVIHTVRKPAVMKDGKLVREAEVITSDPETFAQKGQEAQQSATPQKSARDAFLSDNDARIAELEAKAAPQPEPAPGPVVGQKTKKPKTRKAPEPQQAVAPTPAPVEPVAVPAPEPVAVAPKVEPTQQERRAYTDSQGNTFTEERMAPQDLGVYPGLQYKKVAISDPENAVTDQLKNVQVYDHATAGPLTVWETLDGKRYVVNGHHRRELAIRTGVEDVPVRVFRESEGVGFVRARAIGALQNIRDGKGTALDAATVLRDMGLGRSDLAKAGVDVRRGLARDANNLLKLDPESLRMVEEGQIEESVAAAIGDVLEGDPQKQAIAMRHAKGLDSPSVARELAAQVKRRQTITRDDGTGNLFGDVLDDVPLKEIAEISDGVAKRLVRNARLFDSVSQGKAVGGTVVDKAAQTDAASLERTAAQWMGTSEKVQAALEEAARDYAEAGTRQAREAAVERVYEVARADAEERVRTLTGRQGGGDRDLAPGPRVQAAAGGVEPSTKLQDFGAANDARIAELEAKTKGQKKRAPKNAGAANLPSADELELLARKAAKLAIDAGISIEAAVKRLAKPAHVRAVVARFDEIAGDAAKEFDREPLAPPKTKKRQAAPMPEQAVVETPKADVPPVDPAKPTTEPDPARDVVGVSVAQRQAEAQTRGTQEPVRIGGKTLEELADGGRPEVGRTRVHELADSGAAANDADIADIAAGRLEVVRDLEAARKKLDADIAAGRDATASREAYQEALAAANAFDSSLDVVKSTAGKALNALKIGYDIDEGSFAQVVMEASRRKGSALDPKAEEAFRQATEELGKKQARIAELEAKVEDLNKKVEAGVAERKQARAEKTSADRNTREGRIRQSEARVASLHRQLAAAFGKTSANPMLDPEAWRAVGRLVAEEIKLGSLKLDDAVRKVVEDIAAKHGARLDEKAVRDAFMNPGKKKGPQTPEQQKLSTERQRGRLEDSIADMRNQLETGALKGPKKRKDPIEELDDLRVEAEMLRAQIRRDIAAQAPKSAFDKAWDLLNFGRSAVTGPDNSGLFRQAIFSLANDPVKWAKGAKGSFASLTSKKASAKFAMWLKQQPEFARATRDGMVWGDQSGLVSTREEAFLFPLVEKIPLYGKLFERSSDAMATLLNRIRYEKYKAMVSGKNLPKEQRREIVRQIMAETGRGSFNGQADVMLTAMGKFGFSPRLAVAAFQTPLGIVSKNPAVRMSAAKGVVGMVAAGNAILSAAKQMGAQVGDDPGDSDYGKIIVGDQRIDIWGHYGAAFRLVAKLVKMAREAWDGEKPKFGDSPEEAVARYLSYKASPAVSNLRSLAYKRNAIGEPVTFLDFVAANTVPLSARDMWESWKVEGKPNKVAATGALSFLGVGSSTYEKGAKKQDGPRSKAPSSKAPSGKPGGR